jgi:hypothetical protein
MANGQDPYQANTIFLCGDSDLPHLAAKVPRNLQGSGDALLVAGCGRHHPQNTRSENDV